MTKFKCKYKRCSAHALTEHPIHKAPGAVSLLGPPQQVDNRGALITRRGRRRTLRSTIENPNDSIKPASLFSYTYVSAAVTASSEAVLQLWSTITHHNASCLGCTFEHALSARLLKDTELPAWGHSGPSAALLKGGVFVANAHDGGKKMRKWLFR